MSHRIDTGRLQLVSCDSTIFDALLAGPKVASALLQVDIPPRWTQFGKRPIQYAYDQLRAEPTSLNWWTYLPIHTADNRLIGSCGYKGPPDEHGIVEIGYEIMKPYRRQGLGTELAKGLIANAFADNRVTTVQAHTLARENPSCKILRHCGMTWMGDLTDVEDGLLWRWQLNRSTFGYA